MVYMDSSKCINKIIKLIASLSVQRTIYPSANAVLHKILFGFACIHKLREKP